MEFDAEERQTPCPLGLIAATVALMTRYADPAPGQTASGPCDVHPLLAKKIAANLLFLQHHPELPSHFAQVMAQARTQWCGMVEHNAGSAPLPAAHAHPSMRH